MALLDKVLGISSDPNITPIDSRSSTQTSGTQSGSSTGTQTGRLSNRLTGKVDGTLSRRGGGTQTTGLVDQSLLNPIRGLLGQVSGTPSAAQQNALGALSQSLAGLQGASTPAGYAADRQQVLQDAANSGRLVNANLASSGLSGNASAGTNLRGQIQDQTQQNLLSAFDRNRNAQLQQVGNLAQLVQGVGDQQRLAPVTTASAYGAALSPFSRQGVTDQHSTDVTDQTTSSTQLQNTLQQLQNQFQNQQAGTSDTQGSQDHAGPSDLQGLLGLLGGIGGIVGGFRGNT